MDICALFQLITQPIPENHHLHSNTHASSFYEHIVF